MRNPKKNLRKESWERTSGTTKWDKLEGGLQILVGQLGQGGGGLQIFVGQVGQGQGVCPLEPFHLSQMGLQGHERFQMFITTPIGATSTNFVVKRDLQNFDSTCGSLWKSFWRHDMKNTRPHLKGFKGTSSGTKVHHPALSFFQNSNRISAEISGFDMNCFFCSSRFLVISHQFRLVWVYSNFPAAARVHIFVPGEKIVGTRSIVVILHACCCAHPCCCFCFCVAFCCCCWICRRCCGAPLDIWGA